MKKKIKKGACGCIISQSMDGKMTKKHGVCATMMCYILPDKQYKKYISLKKLGKDKEASKIFEQYNYLSKVIKANYIYLRRELSDNQL